MMFNTSTARFRCARSIAAALLLFFALNVSTAVAADLVFSITEGIAFGFIAYALLMLGMGRGREVHPLLYLFAVLFVLRYAFLM